MTPEEKKVFDQMREALEKIVPDLRGLAFVSDTAGELATIAAAAIAAANAVSEQLQAQVVAEPLYRAAINCPHEIDRDQIILSFDPKQPGHNALNQLGRRLDAALQVQPKSQACKDCGQSTKQDLIHTCSPQVAKPERVETAPNYGGWVPMAERLPPTEVPILVCAYDGTVTAAVFEHTPGESWISWHGAGFGGYEWDWDWDASLSLPWRGVTHWMPLPPAPEAA